MNESLKKYLSAIDSISDEVNQIDLSDIYNPNRKNYLFTKANCIAIFGKDGFISPHDIYINHLIEVGTLALDIKTDIEILAQHYELKGDRSYLNYNTTDQPCVFASFHFGPYQFLISYLLSINSSMSVLSLGDYKPKDVVSSVDMADINADVSVINPNNWNTLLQLSLLLKQRKSIMVFLDRIDGVKTENTKKMFKVPFFKQQLFVRRGIPELAYQRKAPIIPVIAYRTAEKKICVEFFEPIEIQTGESKQAFTDRVLTHQYNLLAKYIKIYPGQWEYWPEVHTRLDFEYFNSRQNQQGQKRFLNKLISWIFNKAPGVTQNKEEILPGDMLRFNNEAFGIYVDCDLCYMLEISKLNCFKITENLFKLLAYLAKEPREFKSLKVIINNSLLTELLEKRILIRCSDLKPLQ